MVEDEGVAKVAAEEVFDWGKFFRSVKVVDWVLVLLLFPVVGMSVDSMLNVQDVSLYFMEPFESWVFAVAVEIALIGMVGIAGVLGRLGKKITAAAWAAIIVMAGFAAVANVTAMSVYSASEASKFGDVSESENVRLAFAYLWGMILPFVTVLYTKIASVRWEEMRSLNARRKMTRPARKARAEKAGSTFRD